MATRGRPSRSVSPPPRPVDPDRRHLCKCERICKLTHQGGQWLTRSQKTSHKIVIDLAPAVNQCRRGTGARGPALLPRSQATRGRGVPATTRGRGQTGRGISRPAAQAHYAGVLPSSKRSRTASPSLNESTSRPRLTISPASKPTALPGDARAPSPQEDMQIDVAPLDFGVQPDIVNICYTLQSGTPLIPIYSNNTLQTTLTTCTPTYHRTQAIVRFVLIHSHAGHYSQSHL